MGGLKTFSFGIVLGGACLAQVAACGHLGMDELPLAEEGLTADGGSSGTTSSGVVGRDGGSSGNGGPDGSTTSSSGGSSGDGGDVDPRDAEPDVVRPIDGGDGCSALLPCDVVYVDSNADEDGDGSARRPAKTIARGVALAASSGRKRVHILDGSYDAAETELKDGIHLIGGYTCTNLPCDWKYAPSGKTFIRATSPDGLVISEKITRGTTIQSVHVVGTVGTGASTSAVAVSIEGGSPVLRDVEIELGHDAVSSNTAARLTALSIDGVRQGDGPYLEDCTIRTGAAQEESIGIALASKTFSAATPKLMMTGGSVSSNKAATSIGVRAIKTTVDSTLIEKAIIQAGPSTATTVVDPGTSWAVFADGGIKLQMSRINPRGDQDGTMFCSSRDFCGGVKSTGALVLHSNWIGGAYAPQSAAVLLEGTTGGLVIVNGNTLDGGGIGGGIVGSDTISAAVVVRSALTVGRVRNNLLGSGSGTTRYNVYEDRNSNGQSAHLEALYNNAFYHTNVSGHADHAYRYIKDGAVVDLAFTELKGIVTPQDENITIVDPFFTDAAVPKVHIDPDLSPLVNKGRADAEAPPKDIDGTGRVKGERMDIGAHEAK
ncbi:MAG: hypothetical protein KIT84_38180 [Labilithrix sp.]|nr:hypothetical protein [Labilithrix sp.]MCW5816888.1 hypothetical protein [Labilithrix sp.]